MTIKLEIVSQHCATKLISEERVSYFPTATFSVDKHADFFDGLFFYDNAGRDGMFLADFFKNPGGLIPAPPIALAKHRKVMTQDTPRGLSAWLCNPQDVWLWNRTLEDLAEKDFGGLVDVRCM